MKRQVLSEFTECFNGGARNPSLENKEVISLRCRLSVSQTEDGKMKVEPGMFMKLNGLKNDLGKNRECYRKISHLSPRTGNVIETKGDSR